MKKILVFINYFGVKSESFIFDEIQFLNQQEISLDVLHYSKPIKNTNIFGLDIPSTFWHRWLHAPGKLTLNFFKSLRYSNGRKALLAYLIKFFESKQYDVIYCHFGINGKLIAELMELGLISSSTKLVVRFHGMDMNFSKYPYNYYRILIRNVSITIAGSDYAINNLYKYGFRSNQVIKLPVGVKLVNLIEPLEFQNSPQVFKIVSIGRLIELKGHLQSLEIMKVLKSKGIPFNYYIIGSGPMLNQLNYQILTSGLEKYVFILGPLNHDLVLKFLRNSHLYIYTGIVDHTGRQETQGLSNIEAMALGLPVLSNKVGGISEYIIDGHTGFLCNGDFLQFANKIKFVIDNFYSGKILKIRKNAVKMIKEKYCQETLNLKLLDILLN